MMSNTLRTLESPDPYTVAWIAALPIERSVAEAMLDEQHGRPKGFSQHPSDTNSYTWGRIGEHNVVIASLKAGVYGLVSAGTTASCLSSSLPSIRIGLLVGIGGGFSRPDTGRDIRLGDVVVSQPNGTTGGVYQYDLVKLKPGNRCERKGYLAPPPDVLLHAIANIQSAHERRDSEITSILQDMLKANPKMAKSTKQNPGYMYQGSHNDRLFQSSYEHVSGQDCGRCIADQEVQRDERESTAPEIHYGIIVSGNALVKDSSAREQIVNDVGEECICFEMEAAGLMNHFPCLVIRGIGDYADSHKNDRWQRYASATAAAYAKELLSYVPARGVQESKRALEILESVNERLDTTQQTTLAVKATVESLALDSRRHKMRQWLSAPDPTTNANHARELRHDGTGTWLLENPVFLKWISGVHRHLWLRGIPGCGKTVLSATIIDHLTMNGDLLVLSFFFDFNDTMKQTKNGLLRSLTLQVHQGCHDAVEHLEKVFRAHRDGEEKPTTTTLEEAFRIIIAAIPKVAIVLDALDESTSREEVLSWLKVMFSDPRLEHVQAIYTSRNEAEFLRDIPDLIGGQCCLSIDGEAIDTDIRSYVMTRIQNDPGFARKRLSEDLLGRIHNEVGNGAQGMFRWAACQLDSLVGCLSPKDIEKALHTLPVTLEETYHRMLQSIPHNYRKGAMRLLQFIVYSKRPLSLKEAVDIVATDVEAKQPHFDIGHRVFDHNDILRHCPSFVSTVTVKDDWGLTKELHLAHFSVKEYLLLQDTFGSIDASINITKICLIYIRDIEGHRWKLAEEFPLATYAAEVLMDFAVVAEVSEEVLKMLTAFLKQEETFQRWIYLHEVELDGADYPGIPTGSTFYYCCVSGLKSIARTMLDDGIDVNALQGGLCGNALQAASYYGHAKVVRLLLDKGADVNMQCGMFGNALQAASCKSNVDIACLLIERHADVNAQGGRYGNALQAASQKGHLGVVRLLLDNRADVGAQGGEHGNALIAACYGGHIKVAGLLLDHNADINAGETFLGNALEVASSNGHIEVVKMLLARGANAQIQAGFYGGALKAACARGHFDVVQTLLVEGVDIHAHGGFNGTSLQAAAYGGNEKIVQTMLDLGADVNALGGNFGSPLQAACWRGHEGIVKMLLNLGADVNAHGGDYGSSLHAACASGNGNILKILRDFNADSSLLYKNHACILDEACQENRVDVVELLADFIVDIAPDNDVDAYLQTACFFGSDNVIRALITIGANVNAQGGTHGSPLQAACNSDEKATVQLLVESGAMINNCTKYGSALHTAASKGNSSLVEMLIDMGADTNAHGSGTVYSTNALLAASFEGHSDIVRTLLINGAEASIRDEEGRTPLHAAAFNGYVAVAGLLLDAGAEINANSDLVWTPITVASAYGHIEVVKMLLERGADVSVTSKDGNTSLLAAAFHGHVDTVELLLDIGGFYPDHRHDKNGITTLSIAAEGGCEQVVKFLAMNTLVDVDSKDTVGRTALSHASKGGHSTIVDILLRHGASTDLSDHFGSTPLSFAARIGFTMVVEMLLAAGANVNSRDCFQRTPVWWAAKRGNTEVVEILLQHESQQDLTLGDESDLGINLRPSFSPIRYCDICVLDISEDCSFYSCMLCSGGDFDVCEFCFASGGHCLKRSHKLISQNGSSGERVAEQVSRCSLES